MSEVIENKVSCDVSIVVPIYNGEKYIAAKLDSLIGIEGVTFEVIVSLNKSTDESEKVVDSFRNKLPNLRVIRHFSFLAAGENFYSGVKAARGNFIFVSAVDDICDKGFYREAITILNNRNSACAVTPMSRFNDSNHGNRAIGFEVCGNIEERVITLFKNIRVSHGIFYSLMRRSTANFLYENFTKDCLMEGGDWLFDLRLAFVGEVLRAKGSECVFGVRGMSRNKNYLSRYNVNKFKRVFPYGELAMNILKLAKRQSLRVRFALLKIAMKLLWGNIHRFVFDFCEFAIRQTR